MTTVKKVLIESKVAENSETLQYTAVDVITEIDSFVASNKTVTNATLNIKLVPPGGAPGDAGVLSITKTIVPGYPWTFPSTVGQILMAGGTLYTTAGTADAIQIRSCGREYS